jgi:hypothetical protein
MESRLEIRKFISLARAVGLILGKEKDHSYHCGCPIENVFEYEDEHIRIVAGKFDLTLGVDRKANNNPCIIVEDDGSILRWHGEAWELNEHLNKLVSEKCLLTVW